MKIAVIGATGSVGRQLVGYALDDGHEVTAAIRNPADLATAYRRLRIVGCDVRAKSTLELALSGQDVVFCALGDPSRGPTDLYSTGARNVAAAAAACGVKRIVFLSNYGAMQEKATDLKSAVLLFLIRRLLSHTIANHAKALDILRAQPIDWIAVRAMPMTNGRYTARYRVVREGLPPGGSKISRADVADFMLKQATSDTYVNAAPSIAY